MKVNDYSNFWQMLEYYPRMVPWLKEILTFFQTNIFMYKHPLTYLENLRNKIIFDNIPSSISKFVRLSFNIDKDYLVTLAETFCVSFKWSYLHSEERCN